MQIALQDRDCLLNMIRCLRDGNSRMAKFMYLFFDLSAIQQDHFVDFMHERVGDDRWNEVAKDRMLYPEFIKALLMHYGGLDGLNQATLEDLSNLVGVYFKSGRYKKAIAEIFEQGEME